MADLDDIKPGRLVEDVKGEHGDRARNTVIAIGTILLVVIAYLTLKHLGGGGAGGSDAANPDTGNAGDVGTEGTAEDTDINGIVSQLGAENGVLVAGFAKLSSQLKATNKRLALENKREAQIRARLKRADKLLAKAGAQPKHHKTKHHTGSKHDRDHGKAQPHHPAHKPKHPARLGHNRLTHI
jgi:hypothetical protein